MGENSFPVCRLFVKFKTKELCLNHEHFLQDNGNSLNAQLP